jgi:hypothetical protein
MKKKHSGEGKHPDVTLGEGLEIGSVHPAHIKGVTNSLGNHQAKDVAPSGESDHETLRHGKKPQPEKVLHAPMPMNPGTLAKARMFNDRSVKGGAEKEGGW